MKKKKILNTEGYIFQFFSLKNLKSLLNKLKATPMSDEYRMLYEIDED